MSIQHCK